MTRGYIFVDNHNPHDQRTTITIPAHTMTMNNTQPDALFYPVAVTPQLGSIEEPIPIYVSDEGFHTLGDFATQLSNDDESEDSTDQLLQELGIMLSRN
mmetsp:Transcript_25244/g.45710  ORF Transcript_25244/g.45710 Transcript_25244/m.45710 type:complete len:98 (-) Transcript_25244:327-620(-)